MNDKLTETGRFVREYLAGLVRVVEKVDEGEVAALIQELKAAYDADRQIFIIGNGGSAATASHMACDLAKNILGQMRGKTRHRFRVLSMTDNVAMITALANDLGYDQIFTEQLILYGKPGDLLLVISGSGNSPNIVKAVELARQMGLKTAGMLGFDGGRVRPLLDTVVLVDDCSYGYVEDLHMIFDHLITGYFNHYFAATSPD